MLIAVFAACACVCTDRCTHIRPVREGFSAPSPGGGSALVAPTTRLTWPCGTQGRFYEPCVPQGQNADGLVCHWDRTRMALCATGTERGWPCVPQGQNADGHVCHRDRTPMALCHTRTDRAWPCVSHGQTAHGLACHGDRPRMALCASGTDRAWPCVPQAQNGIGSCARRKLPTGMAGVLPTGMGRRVASRPRHPHVRRLATLKRPKVAA